MMMGYMIMHDIKSSTIYNPIFIFIYMSLSPWLRLIKLAKLVVHLYIHKKPYTFFYLSTIHSFFATFATNFQTDRNIYTETETKRLHWLINGYQSLYCVRTSLSLSLSLSHLFRLSCTRMYVILCFRFLEETNNFFSSSLICTPLIKFM